MKKPLLRLPNLRSLSRPLVQVRSHQMQMQGKRKSTRQMPAPGQQSWPMAASHPVLWEDQKAPSSLWPIPWAYCSDPKRWGQGRGRWSGWCMGTSNFPASTWPHQLQLKARRLGFRHLVLRWGTSLWASPREGFLLTSQQRKRFHHQRHSSWPAGSSLRNRCQQSSNRNIRKGDLSPWALWLSKSPGVPSLMRSTKLEPVINDATLRVNWSLLSVQDSHSLFSCLIRNGIPNSKLSWIMTVPNI